MRLALLRLLPLALLLFACRTEKLVTPPEEEVPISLWGLVLEADGEPARGVKINLLYELVGYPEASPPPDDLPPLVDTLLQNYPNPFNPLTLVRFALAEAQPIRLMVMDAEGDTLRTLAHGALPAGMHSVTWDGRDDLGELLPNDVYRIRLAFQADGDEQEIDGVFFLSRDPAILAESALATSDEQGRFNIPLADLPIDRMIPTTTVDGTLHGIFPVSSIVQVHAGRTGHLWTRATLDIGNGDEDIDVELQLP